MVDELVVDGDVVSGGTPLDSKVVVLADLDRSLRKRGPNVAMPDLAEDTGVDESVIIVAFPGGREQLLQSVIGNTCDEFDEVVTAPMVSAPTRTDALREAADGLAAYYEGGARHCLFELFSVPEGTAHLPGIKATASRFLDGLTTVFVQDGKTQTDARAKACRLFAELQGTLILARLTGDTQLFRAFTDNLARTR